MLWVFVPPVARFDDFCALVRAIDAARVATGVDVHVEGYAPPPSPELRRFAVTPDPGVLEVNLPPARSGRELAELHATVFDAALACGLTAERFMLDGRSAGSGGGNHITIGGPSPERSPWLERPDLLASLLTFAQHHPSLSYMFSGLFVGPTSQAPRVDEARHDSLYELELALPRLHERPPAWQVDALLRHLLVDIAGSTHRAEISIDKLFDPHAPFGRQGLVELRAFEMPPHPRMAAAQGMLVRALVAAFTAEPYRHPLVRWGSELHDKFLLPYWLWRDFDDVLAQLAARGLRLPADAYRAFVELRCPLVGTLDAGGATLEVRNAIEPWHVLGEEATQAGTARYVDSSMERIEIRTHGLDPERYTVAINHVELPMRAASGRDVRVGGVRFHRTRSIRTSASIIRCRSISSIPGRSAVSPAPPITCGTPRVAGSMPLRSRASRPKRAGCNGSRAKVRRRGRSWPGEPSRIPTNPTRSISAVTIRDIRCPSRKHDRRSR